MKKLNYQVYALKAGKAGTKDDNNLYIDGEIEGGKIKSIESVSTEKESLIQKPDVDEDLIEYLEQHPEISIEDGKMVEEYIVDTDAKFAGLKKKIEGISLNGDMSFSDYEDMGALFVFGCCCKQKLVFKSGVKSYVGDDDNNHGTCTITKDCSVVANMSEPDKTWVKTYLRKSNFTIVPD